MHIALKGCRPPHTNEPVQFWIDFGLVLIGLNPLGLLTPHWIIQIVIDRNAIENLRRQMGPIFRISGQGPKEGGLKAK